MAIIFIFPTVCVNVVTRVDLPREIMGPRYPPNLFTFTPCLAKCPSVGTGQCWGLLRTP